MASTATIVIRSAGLVQRVTIAAWVAAVVLLALLHNPFSGYITTFTSNGTPCPVQTTTLEQTLQMSASETAASIQALKDCAPKEVNMAFSEWGTVDPAVGWLRSVVHLLVSMGAVTLVAGVVYWLFPPKRST
ncbi:hypothetical protein [Paraburkholderia xenovorans]|uniref:hypothetical protein n=1 Tax=Paraburkholderia xenovorans TaxID=36873 RepID=UPI0015C544B1|nr:hypothetical protein [Paraburkholderia xenovorans]NPT36337.1 hypothetical protein [Paraburkholderia xenovorans]